MSSRRAVTATLALSLLVDSAAWALDPKRAVTQYHREAWSTKDGLPQGSAEAIAQTPDGYLWIGTQEGLARFDGVRFVVFNKSGGFLQHNRVVALIVDRSGTLWIATAGGGLSVYRDGSTHVFKTSDPLPSSTVNALAEDVDGSLWIATAGGLAHLKEGRLTTTVRGRSITALSRGHDGALLLGGRDGRVQRLHGGQLEDVVADRRSGPVFGLWQDSDDTLWIAFLSELVRVRGSEVRSYSAEAGSPGMRPRAIYRDRDGTLWVGTDQSGVARLRNDRFEVLSGAEGLSNHLVAALYEDREGSLWVGTQDGGINRLSNGKVVGWTRTEGLPDDIVWPVVGNGDDTLWVGTSTGGLARLRDGFFTTLTRNDGLPSNSIQALTPDGDGGLWVGTRGGGLALLKSGQWRYWTSKDGLPSDSVSALCKTRDGTLWIGTRGGGVTRLFRNSISTTGIPKSLEFQTIHSIHQDRLGDVWIATDGQGLVRQSEGSFVFYTTKDGLASDAINTLLEDDDGTLWIGTYGGGLSRLRDGQITTYTTAQGLYDDAIFGLLDDLQGHLWMSCNRGISRIDRAEIEALDRSQITSLHPKVFDTDDGMPSQECNGANQPPAWRSRDGRLWFPTVKGLVAIDPSHMNENTLPPPVTIEELIVGDRSQPARQPLVIPPGAKSLEIRYTAPSLRAPRRVRFSYRLEGLGQEWLDVGTRRAAYFTNLSPGRYAFEVKATNDDGVWSEPGARLEFQLLPRFYQTVWFKLVVAAMALTVGVATYRLRVRHLVTRERQLAELVAVRTQELHAAKQHFSDLADRREREDTVRLLEECALPAELAFSEQPTLSNTGATRSLGLSIHPLAARMLGGASAGLRIAHRYDLIELLGEGGMGVVYRAHDTALGEMVALKLVPEELQVLHYDGDTLRHELRLARRVTHANVVRTHDFGEAGGIAYISMEYVKGLTLTELLRRKGALPLTVAIGLSKQMCRALEAAHGHGVVHRDIKPRNMLIARATGELKIADFGVAEFKATGRADGERVSGTPAYMSPEQAHGLRTDFASDLYSLGVVLYEVFTGRLPFDGSSVGELALQHASSPPPQPRSLAPALPEDVEALILHCLAKQASSRPPSASAVLARLVEASLRLAGEPTALR